MPPLWRRASTCSILIRHAMHICHRFPFRCIVVLCMRNMCLHGVVCNILVRRFNYHSSPMPGVPSPGPVRIHQVPRGVAISLVSLGTPSFAQYASSLSFPCRVPTHSVPPSWGPPTVSGQGSSAGFLSRTLSATTLACSSWCSQHVSPASSAGTKSGVSSSTAPPSDASLSHPG